MVALLLDRFLFLVLVFIRLSGLMISAPLLSTREIPVQVRGLLAFSLALIVTPLLADQPLPNVQNLVQLGLLVGSELAIGFVLGLGLMVLLQGLQLAGEMVSRVAGLGMGEIYDPLSDAEVPAISQLLFLIGMLTFLICGGERALTGGILESFRAVRLGEAFNPENEMELLLETVQSSCVLAVRVSAPAVATLLVVTLVLGLIGRTLPQLNLLMLGFGLNGLAAMGALLLAAGLVVTVFEQELVTAFDRVFPWGPGL